MDAIYSRNSVRKFTDQLVDKSAIEELLTAAAQAPSAMNAQPWVFGIIQNTQSLQQLSDQAKAFLLDNLAKHELLTKYRSLLAKPDFNIFYNASTLLTIYAKQGSPHPVEDCSLAAQNIMLTAHSKGLGTCWIGFATPLLNQPDIKERMGIPDSFITVAPIIVGYPAASLPPAPKKQAEVLYWK